MSGDDFQSVCKIVLIGDSGVGKTSLVSQFTQHGFDRNSKPTMGIKMVITSAIVNSRKIKVKIWDTAGQERYRSPTPYYNDAAGVMLVYDISKRETFENIKQWLGEVRDHAEKDVRLVLVGNKRDLFSQEAVTYGEGETLARAEGMAFFETSADNQKNVGVAFQDIICGTQDP